MTHDFVSGGAGLIGSQFVEELLGRGHSFCAYDDHSGSHDRWLRPLAGNDRFSFVRGEVLDQEATIAAMKGAEIVVHLASFSVAVDGPSS